MDDKVRCENFGVAGSYDYWLFKKVGLQCKKKRLWHVESSKSNLVVPQALVLNVPEVPNAPLTPGSSYGLAAA